VQEVFLILWEKRETIKPDRIKSYLYTVANNLYIDQYRHEQLKLGLCHEYNYSKEVCSPEYLFELKEFDERLQHAIASLVEKERTVFLMNRVDGLTFNDIAENLDISVKAVEKRMHNAIEKLYKKLNHKL
jgi:RNA polymerase sigma factor (sigma-70 family)